MFDLLRTLFPICRSITGDGVRETLRLIKGHIPIELHEVPTGTQVFDWTVPQEWNIRDAYVMDSDGNRVIDFRNNNLHVVGYSEPVDRWIDLDELRDHLYTLPEQPDAIPYVTSYYERRWGFCLSHNDLMQLRDGEYRVVIDSDLEDGHLTYAELVLRGDSDEEIFLSTYVCHPSMANNELSGPVVLTHLAKWLMGRDRRYTYRIVFIPETIGALTYLSRNLDHMKGKVVAGFNLTCVGDNRAYSLMPSRSGDTLADRVALTVLEQMHPDFVRYSFLDRGSDERQYCSPGVDLPLVSVMRTKYWEYPEYHTSLDNLDIVTPDGLYGSYEVYQACMELLERNARYRVTCLGEPQLSKRGLYPTVSSKNHADHLRSMRNFLAYADGERDLIDISRVIEVPPWELYPIIDQLTEVDLIETG